MRRKKRVSDPEGIGLLRSPIKEFVLLVEGARESSQAHAKRREARAPCLDAPRLSLVRVLLRFVAFREVAKELQKAQ
eukprot:scaffold475_cov279-Pinguiococcus_pyrenoidosus.AAC.10